MALAHRASFPSEAVSNRIENISSSATSNTPSSDQRQGQCRLGQTGEEVKAGDEWSVVDTLPPALLPISLEARHEYAKDKIYAPQHKKARDITRRDRSRSKPFDVAIEKAIS
jgi:hypothetical protein